MRRRQLEMQSDRIEAVLASHSLTWAALRTYTTDQGAFQSTPGVYITTDLAAYLGQIGSEEVAAPAALPAGAVRCASERGNCSLPSGTPATVYYGADSRWVSIGAVNASIACNNSVFGDPAYGTGKACYYVAATKCSNERATCTVPAGRTATVIYGANGRYHLRTGVSGALACNNTTFADPLPGVGKSCWLR